VEKRGRFIVPGNVIIFKDDIGEGLPVTSYVQKSCGRIRIDKMEEYDTTTMRLRDIVSGQFIAGLK